MPEEQYLQNLTIIARVTVLVMVFYCTPTKPNNCSAPSATLILIDKHGNHLSPIAQILLIGQPASVDGPEIASTTCLVGWNTFIARSPSSAIQPQE